MSSIDALRQAECAGEIVEIAEDRGDEHGADVDGQRQASVRQPAADPDAQADGDDEDHQVFHQHVRFGVFVRG